MKQHVQGVASTDEATNLRQPASCIEYCIGVGLHYHSTHCAQEVVLPRE
jgi:hypothetical protein